MTRLLDKAFQEAAKLPEAEQDAIARHPPGGRGATRPLDPDSL